VIETYKEELIALRGKVDMVVGGPPCQGFSTAGKRKEDDVRNGLIKSYLRFILHVRPKVIFFENVKGFTLKFEKNKSKGIAYSQYVLRVLRMIGYDVEGKMIDFSKYGIPQKRTRFILVGIRREITQNTKVTAKRFFRELTKNKKNFLAKKNLPQSPNVGSAISDLLKGHGLTPTTDRKGGFNNGLYSDAKSKYQKFLRLNSSGTTPNSHSFPKHRREIEKRFKLFLTKPKGKNLSAKTKKRLKINKHTIIPLCANMKAPTITTLPDDYIHYSEPRILTVREYARVQSFPDWYEFKGKYTTGGKERTKEVPRYTQIGNAIPPLFGEQSGLVLKSLIR
jgi:DNA (cytosine-5)-methyltransferase 1